MQTYKIFESFKEFLAAKNVNEGGNAIASAARINQENVESTLNDIYNRLLPKLGLKKEDTALLGSTGKKNPGSSSGDIDLGIDLRKLITSSNGLETVGDVYDFISKVAQSFKYEIKDMRSLGVISIGWPISNGSYEDRYQNEQVVQLDLMPSDSLDWTSWSYYSPAEWESKYKGVYRNMLLFAVAKYIDLKVLKTALNKEGIETDAEWERHFFDMNKGLMKGVQSSIGKSGNIVKTKTTRDKFIISNDPEMVVQMMFGPKYAPNNLLTFNEVLDAILDKDFIYAKNKQKILREAADGILNSMLPLPEELANVI